MAALYLASTAVMALLAVGVFVLIVRGRPWHHYVPTAVYGAASGQPESVISRAASDVNTWTAAYILLVLGVIAGAFVTLSGALAGPALIAVLAAWALGLLLVLGISVKLALGL